MGDIGSGTGRPTLYMSCLDIAGSLGFDIDPMQVYNSCHGLAMVEKSSSEFCKLKSTVCFYQGNTHHIKDLEPVTHAYSFLGYPLIVNSTARLVASSKSVKVMVAIVLQEREIRSTGMLDNRDDIIC